MTRAAAKKTAAAPTAQMPDRAEAVTPTVLDGPTPTVHEAWNAVMDEAQYLGKNQRYSGGEGGGNFVFRGIDDVMNLVGPLLRKHRVSVVPSVRSANYRDVMTRGGKTSREVTVLVDYTITGPAGDTMHGSAPGESMDTGDKGTAKAMSVALRVFFLQALCLPTNEPDPDSQVFERGGNKTPEELAQSVVERMPEKPTIPQVQGVKGWAQERALLDVTVRDGDRSLPLLAYLDGILETLTATDPEAQAAKQATVDKAFNGGGSGEQPPKES